MPDFTPFNVLTWDEKGTGKLIELLRADATLVHDYGIGNADLTYAHVAPFLNAVLLYGPAAFSGAIRIVNKSGASGDNWIAQAVVDDIDDLLPAGLIVSSALDIVFIQQVASTEVAFVVRRFELLGAVVDFTVTLVNEPGATDVSYQPVGGWQDGVLILGAAINGDGSKVYVMTKQFIYQASLGSSGAVDADVLVDFGGDTMGGGGGLAFRASDGHLFAGVVDVLTAGSDFQQRYSINEYDTADGSLITSDPVATQNSQPAPAADYSFGPQMSISPDGNDLWWFMEHGAVDPTFFDAAIQLQEDVFHGEDVTPPPLGIYPSARIPGAVARVGTLTPMQKFWLRLVY